MVASSRRSPRAYVELIAAGAHDGQTPPWIMRPRAKGASTPAEVVEHVVIPTQTPPGSTDSPPLEHENKVPSEHPPRTQTPNTPTPMNTPNTYEPHGTAGEHLGSIYAGVRERDARLQALGIIRTEDGRHLQAVIRPDGTPGYREVDPAARLRRREGEARPRLLRFMSIWLQEEIDVLAIAVKFNVSQQKVASMMASARRSPRAYGELIASGAHDGQIPPWIMRPGDPGDDTTTPPTPPSTPEPPTSTLETTIPPGRTQETPPPRVVDPEALPGTRRTGGEGGIAVDLDDPSRGDGGRLGALYDGVRLQSERLDNLGIIRDQGGRYLKASTNLDGSPGFVEVDPVEVDRNLTKDIGSMLSEAAVGQLNVHMRTVMRKVWLNPTVFMSYSWAVSEKGYEGDLGDFINQAIKYMMKSRGRLVVNLVINGTIYGVCVNPN